MISHSPERVTRASVSDDPREDTNEHAVDALQQLRMPPPPMDPTNIEGYFLTLKYWFIANGISAAQDKARYNYVMAQIPPNTLLELQSKLEDVPRTGQYAHVRKVLLEHHSDSQQRRLQRVLAEMTLGDQKPSQLYNEMRRVANDTISELALVGLWTARLPTNVRDIVVANRGPVSEKTAVADAVMESQRWQPINVIESNQQGQPTPTPTFSLTTAPAHAAQPTNEQLMREIRLLHLHMTELKQQVKRLSLDFHTRSSSCNSRDSDKTNLQPTSVALIAANGTRIPVHGEAVINVNLGLRRNFLWTFVIADVTTAIIGSDFLAHHDLLIDLRRRRLIDNTTRVEQTGTLISGNRTEIKAFIRAGPCADILQRFPALTTTPPPGSIYNSTETVGQPTSARPRRLPPDKLAAARAEFDILLQLGICRPSRSNWASPLHMVPKPDGTWRPCGDYRALNAQTVLDRYPVPYLQDFTATLAGKRVFAKIDLLKAFHQVPVNPSDVPKTAIITTFGLFEFQFMTFGLRNAAQTFQRIINELVRGLDFVFVYIDDIFVASTSMEEHRAHLEQLFQRLEEHHLRINPTKTELGKEVISFLGHLDDSRGIRPLPDRVDALRTCPTPTTVKDLKSFLATLNFYRRFIPDALQAQAPLLGMIPGNTRNDKTPLTWTTATSEAFTACKEQLANCALLAHAIASAELSL
ncbi:uncharacterized protein LOC128270462 [Anopheles cruzii]|uniref:uncharacterized protein LOC128270462 n=1 Tax=Anopheles cruzii TaxID=68878 RepID=UPI0022EC3ABA|nr:uncharacterized protein LOC128270462 [Anopheles cruzii]